MANDPSSLDDAVELLERGALEDGMKLLRGEVRRVEGSDAEQRELYDALVARVGHADPRVGGAFAIAAGVLVEHGQPAAPLAEALVAPLERAIGAARPLANAAETILESDEETGELTEQQFRVRLQEAAGDDVGACDAFWSLDTWYRPAVTALGREPEELRRAQTRTNLVAEARALRSASQGGRWVSLLLAVPVDAPFVVLFPEISTAYSLRITGVADMAQLSVLLSEALDVPLRKIGASGIADEVMLANARGEGKQKVEGTYSCSFHLYPWQSIEPETGLPRNGRFVWEAPGGRGSHSLPADFLPGEIEPIDGTRVLVAVGPKIHKLFVRMLGATRTFGPLRAVVSEVRRLDEQEASEWFTRARDAAASVEPAPPEHDAPAPIAANGATVNRGASDRYKILGVLLVVLLVAMVIVKDRC